MAAEQLRPDQLAWNFGAVLRKHLKGKRTALALIPEILDGLIEEVPSAAFEMPYPEDSGYLFFHGDVTDERVAEMQRELVALHLGLEDDVPIKLTLSTFGGDAEEALALISTIQRIQREGRELNIHVAGYAMSAGSFILQAGHRRTIDEHGWVMIHEARWNPGSQKTIFHKDDVRVTERLESSLIALYTARTGKPEAYYRKLWERRDVYLTAREALQEGLVDAVLRSPRYANKKPAS